MLRIALVVVMAGCGAGRLPGAPDVGATCASQEPECSSRATVAICEGGRWAEYECPSDCSNTQSRRCDWSKVTLGSECPASFGGGALACNAAGTAALSCRGGVVVETTCPRCNRTDSGFDCW